jgi:hypothetical protein
LCFEPRAGDRQAERAAAALREALESGWINAAILVVCEGFAGIGRRGVLHLPAPLFLAFYHQWTSQSATAQQLTALLQWLDDQILLVLGAFCGPEEPQSLDWQYVVLDDDPPDALLPRPP